MIRIERPVTKLCPHVDEIDHGTLVMTFTRNAPELHRLAREIEMTSGVAWSHEAYTRHLAELYPDAKVETYWDTAGWECAVSEQYDLPIG